MNKMLSKTPMLSKLPSVFAVRSYVTPKPFVEIPGPRSFPIVGTAPWYAPYIGKYKHDNLPATYTLMNKEFGDLVREKRHPKATVLHVFNVQDMYDLYNSDGDLPRRRSHTWIGKYRLARPEIYSGEGLLSSNDKKWEVPRDMYKKLLLDPLYARHLAYDFEEITDEMLTLIPQVMDKNGDVNVSNLLYGWGIESIAYVNLKKRFGCLAKQITGEGQALIDNAEMTHHMIYYTETNFAYPFIERYYGKKLFRAQDIFSGIVWKHYKEFLATDGWEDIDCVVSNLFQCSANGRNADERDVFTMLVDMFLAGIDSSSFTLSYILYNLSINKKAQDTLRKEVMKILPNSDSSFSEYEGPTKYLEAVFNESMRVNPVAFANGRILNKDMVFQGYLVPKDTNVMLQHQVASMDERNFENPKAFLPERMLTEERQSVGFLPFGFGARVCIGNKIAEKETFIGLAKIIRNYELTYHGEPVTSTSRLLNFPSKHIVIRFHKISH